MDATQKEKLRALLVGEHLGVLVTQGEDWPTANIQAFGETAELDIIFIMQEGAEKYDNILKHPHVTVLVDTRHHVEPSSFAIHRAWIQGVASEVAKDSPEYAPIREAFLKKNPFEAPYYNAPTVHVIRIKPKRVSYAAPSHDDRFKADF